MTEPRRIDIGPLRLAVREAGAGRPLMLVHGFTGNSTDFADVMGPLAERGWHVVAPDLRGHGRSDQPTDEAAYTYPHFASDVLAVADDLGWDSFTLLGHSMGGMVAQEIVVGAPERITGLILMDTGAGGLSIDESVVDAGVRIVREQGLQAIIDVQRLGRGPLDSAAHQRLCETVPGYAERGENNTLLCAPAMFASMLRHITDQQDRLTRLGAVTCPTLIVVGEQDTPFIDASAAMAGVIAGATVTIIPDAGHSPQFENRAAWLDAVGGFLDRLP